MARGTGEAWLQTLGGWVPVEYTFVYASADAPTFTFTIAGTDLTTVIYPGMRIKLTQTTVKYFIVTKVAFSTDTTVTIYGGTDYTLANAAITAPYISYAKAPAGFPATPAKWTETLRDTSQRTQSSPVNGTWYNIGTLLLSIPIGVWHVDYQVQAYTQVNGSSSGTGMAVALSTSNNSVSDVDLGSFGQVNPNSAQTNKDYGANVRGSKLITLTAKTTYYLIGETDWSATNIQFYGSIYPSIITARCAYL